MTSEKRIFIVGIGPGSYEDMTLRAADAIRKSDVIVGYTVYVSLMRRFFPEKKYLSTGMRGEEQRCRLAFEQASEGRTVSVICSGDAGVYGLASLMFAMGRDYPDVSLQVIPGVTAALSGAAVLGAPLTHDFCLISLSDLMTPAGEIEARIEAAAQSDFVIVLYNPSSRKRAGYLRRACDICLAFRRPDTVCGFVKNIGREGEERKILTLSKLRDSDADMFTTVFIGNSHTKAWNGHMVTPRGYPGEGGRSS